MWRYHSQDDWKGPCEADEIIKLVQGGTLTIDSFVWRDGLTAAVHFHQSELAPRLSGSETPAPVPPQSRKRGHIKNIGQTYGFIASDQDYYFRASSLQAHSTHRPVKGSVVEFDSVINAKGSPEAVSITLLELPPVADLGPDGQPPAGRKAQRGVPSEFSSDEPDEAEAESHSKSSSALRGFIQYYENGRGVIVSEKSEKYGFGWEDVIDQPGRKKLYPTEELHFEPHTRNGVRVAIKVRLVHIKPNQGTIRDYNEVDGTIEDDDTRELLPFVSHHIHHKSYWEYAVGDRVKYKPLVIDGKRCAVRISWLDKRMPLERFANLAKLWNWLPKLSHLAAAEDWDYQSEARSGDYPILANYLFYTFKRIQEQDKIVTAQDSRTHQWLASFNTGLATDKQEEIFAVLKEAPNYDPKAAVNSEVPPPRWVLEGFYIESHTAMMDIHPTPKLATYFERSDLHLLLYDHSLELRIRRDHILKERRDRFLDIPDLPHHLMQNEEALSSKFEIAVNLAIKRVRRNYKAAIPTFSRGELSLLLPLCIATYEVADLALLVQRRNNFYMGWTVLPLDVAYKNARLIARPDTEWLIPRFISD